MAVQGCLRRDLRIFLPGDEVEADGQRGTISRLHEDRTCSITLDAGAGAAPGGSAAAPSAPEEAGGHKLAVAAVEVRAGALIDNMKFIFSDGNAKSYGGEGGSHAGRFDLEPGEIIVRLSGTCGDSLDSVSFHTSSGRSSPIYGNPRGGAPFELKAPTGQAVVGVRRGPGSCASIQGLICIGRSSAFQCGLSVEIRGLQSEEGEQLNGKRGIVAEEHVAASGRVPVCIDGGAVVKSIKPENLVALPESRVLLRDCGLITPAGNYSRRKRIERNLEILHWRGRCELSSSGRGKVSGRGGAEVRREGVHHILRIHSSDPLPGGMAVTAVEMEVTGMDQGWGNTGDSGVVLYISRAGAEAAAAGVEDEALLKVTYDRRRHQGRSQTARTEGLFGPFAPQPGDMLEATLTCPNYPGWSAHAEEVVVRAHAVEEREEAFPGTLPEDWGASAGDAFDRLWDGLRSGAGLAIDHSHLSLRGQVRQRVWAEPAANAASSDHDAGRPALPRLQRLLRGGSASSGGRPPGAEGAEQLLEKLDANTSTAGAPQDPEKRRARYGALRVTVHRTLDAVEQGKEDLLETICTHYADASNVCIYRWEREIANMYDLVTGEATGADSLSAEDEILRVLCAARRQMAESALHSAKGAAGNSDMHFENYFYGSIHFGIPEQVEAARDPNRLNYGSLNMLRPADVQRQLLEAYTPARTREAVREGVLESRAPGAQALRDKVVDWLRANVPRGFREREDAQARQEAWLFEQCHDASFRLKDEALNFLLCGMHVLRADGLACLSGDPAEVAPPVSLASPAAGRPARHGGADAAPAAAPAVAPARRDGEGRCTVQ